MLPCFRQHGLGYTGGQARTRGLQSTRDDMPEPIDAMVASIGIRLGLGEVRSRSTAMVVW